MRLVGSLTETEKLRRLVKRYGEDSLDTAPARRIPKEGTLCGDHRAVLTMLDDINGMERAGDLAELVL
jgi:hypothetical protein